MDIRTAATSGEKARAALLILTVALLAAIAYAPALRGDFVYDDSFLIAGNPAVHSIARALASFGSSYWGHMKSVLPYYRPLPVVSYAIDHAIGGLDPAVYHTTNVLLHAACAGMVSLLVLGIGRRGGAATTGGLMAGAALAGAVAGAHPMHSEAVAAIYCRPELLTAFFSLAFLNLAVRGRSIAALIALLLALFSKEAALGLPLLAPFALAYGRRARKGGSFARAVVFFAIPALAVLGGYAVLRYHALGGWMDTRAITQLDNPLVTATPLEIHLTPVSIVARYGSLWAWPAVLCVERGFDTIPLVSSIFDPWFLAGAILLACGAVALLAMIGRRSPWSLPLAAAGLAYLPASNLLAKVPVLMGERFIYVPSLFACVLIGAAYARLSAGHGQRERIAGRPFGRWGLHAVATALILVAGGWTFSRSFAFRDELTLYADAAASCPRSAKALYNLGNALSRDRRDEEAVQAFRASVAIAPWLAIAHNNMGGSLLNLRRLDESESEYRKAIDLDPGLVKPRASLAMILFYRGKLQLAHDEAMIARSLNPAPDDAEYLDELIVRIEKRLPAARGAP